MAKPKRGSRVADPEYLKKLHSDADSKYRSKNLYLYNKLRDTIHSEEKSTKDKLLLDTLKFIQNMEKEIQSEVGACGLEQLKGEFSMFLNTEETIWKKSHDVEDWWSKVEICLNEGKHENIENHCHKTKTLPKMKKKRQNQPDSIQENYLSDDNSSSVPSLLYISEMDDDTYNTSSTSDFLENEYEKMYCSEFLENLYVAMQPSETT